mgnify:CR=1 FL=1
MIGLDDIHAAARRIEGQVRRTPMIAASAFKTPLPGDAEVMLKLELLQVTGSFKARGATNRLLSMDPAALSHGIVTASGGNHGIATARAGHMAGVKATIFLPSNASPAKIEKLRAWGADTHIVGSVWHEANAAAQDFVRKTGAAYFHPFADPDVVSGQGTVGLEILGQMPDVTTILVAMGGGGLVSGVATAIKALAPRVRVVGIEAEGCPVLLKALEAGHNVGLDKVTTSVATMACARTDDRIFEMVRDHVDEIVLVDEEVIEDAARSAWQHAGLAIELGAATALAAVSQHCFERRDDEKIAVVLCGSGSDGMPKA